MDGPSSPDPLPPPPSDTPPAVDQETAATLARRRRHTNRKRRGRDTLILDNDPGTGLSVPPPQ